MNTTNRPEARPDTAPVSITLQEMVAFYHFLGESPQGAHVKAARDLQAMRRVAPQRVTRPRGPAPILTGLTVMAVVLGGLSVFHLPFFAWALALIGLRQVVAWGLEAHRPRKSSA